MKKILFSAIFGFGLVMNAMSATSPVFDMDDVMRTHGQTDDELKTKYNTPEKIHAIKEFFNNANSRKILRGVYNRMKCEPNPDIKSVIMYMKSGKYLVFSQNNDCIDLTKDNFKSINEELKDRFYDVQDLMSCTTFLDGLKKKIFNFEDVAFYLNGSIGDDYCCFSVVLFASEQNDKKRIVFNIDGRDSGSFIILNFGITNKDEYYLPSCSYINCCGNNKKPIFVMNKIGAAKATEDLIKMYMYKAPWNKRAIEAFFYNNREILKNIYNCIDEIAAKYVVKSIVVFKKEDYKRRISSDWKLDAVEGSVRVIEDVEEFRDEVEDILKEQLTRVLSENIFLEDFVEEICDYWSIIKFIYHKKPYGIYDNNDLFLINCTAYKGDTKKVDIYFDIDYKNDFTIKNVAMYRYNSNKTDSDDFGGKIIDFEEK